MLRAGARLLALGVGQQGRGFDERREYLLRVDQAIEQVIERPQRAREVGVHALDAALELERVADPGGVAPRRAVHVADQRLPGSGGLATEALAVNAPARDLARLDDVLLGGAGKGAAARAFQPLEAGVDRADAFLGRRGERLAQQRGGLGHQADEVLLVELLLLRRIHRGAHQRRGGAEQDRDPGNDDPGAEHGASVSLDAGETKQWIHAH